MSAVQGVADGQGAGRTGARILVIDDDDLVRDYLCRVLERAGYVTVAAADGAKGTEEFGRARFDAIITDILMPQKEGIETILDIRRVDPDVPIIAMSGGSRVAGFDYLSAAKELGATLILKKPFESAALLDALARCLGG